MRNSGLLASIVGTAIGWASTVSAQEMSPALPAPGNGAAEALEVVPAASNGEA
jgi:hypothetical protein